MKKTTLFAVLSVLGILGTLIMAFGAFAPVQAAADPAQVVTPVPGNDTAPGQSTTLVVPNTGGDVANNDAGFFVSGWTLLIIFGVLIVILLVALLARGTDRTV